MGEERYTDWQQIGEGGMATVFKVLDQGLGKYVAIKLLKEDYNKSQMVVNKLKSEVLISRILRHHFICPIHDLYIGPRGVGIVMDLIDGIELKKWLEQNKGHLLDTAQERLDLFKKLMEALAFAHTHIVHRDLKPDNIFLLSGDVNRPVIMDFGISKVGTDDGQEVAGTPKYMAPEQWEAPDKVDQRSDLFAMGIMAYEIFTNRIPPTSLVRVVKTRQPPRVALENIPVPSDSCPVIPPALDRLILQMMAYYQQDRPQSAQEILSALANIRLKDLDLVATGEKSRSQREPRPTVIVNGGIFQLGTDRSDPQGKSNEKPPRRVHITPFRMDIYPVTNRDYRLFLETTGFGPPPLLDHPVFGRPEHPVVAVTWHDAQAYARFAGGKLPSEAQWECAAKAGVKFAPYPWGPEPPSATLANIGGIARATTPVGSFPAGKNPFGLLDLCGNVWEWCEDFWEEDFYAGVAQDAVDPVNPRPAPERSLRGGAFDSMVVTMGRCAFRFHAPPEIRRANIGFRLIYPVERG